MKSYYSLTYFLAFIPLCTLDDEDELDEMFQIFSERLEETFEESEE